jgi:AraC family transcriptional activator of tynA and feaB
VLSLGAFFIRGPGESIAPSWLGAIRQPRRRSMALAAALNGVTVWANRATTEMFMPRLDEPKRAIRTTGSIGRPAPPHRANTLANPSGLREALTRGFPYVLFDVPAHSHGDITARKVGPHAMGYLRTDSWAAEATVRHADALGFGGTLKLVWQLNGAMTYEDRGRAFAINSGELFLTRSSSNYFLKASEGYEALVLSLDAGAHPAWLRLVERGQGGLVLGHSSASAASAAGALALLGQPYDDRTSQHVVHAMFELATQSIRHGACHPPSEQIAPTQLRARWLIRQNIADGRYTPSQLANDLGLSRRSLYNRFADYGITPAAFIRQVRLEQAKQDIESDPMGRTALTTVALRNGFPDSSSLSHAFKSTYGVTPKALRKATG